MRYSLRRETRKPSRFLQGSDDHEEEQEQKEEEQEQGQEEEEEEEEAREEDTITDPKRQKLSESGEINHDSTEPEPEQVMKNSLTVILTDQDVLDCNICFQSLAPPIFQCENGHIACSMCCVKISYRCPSCSLPIGFKRCLAIEKVVESIKVSCQNAQFGCQETLIYSHKSTHEQSCAYIPCECPISNCNFTAPSGQLSQHFTNAHSSLSRRFRYGSRFTICLDRTESFVLIQSEDDGLLFLVKNRKEDFGNSIVVILIGSGESKTEFSYDLVAKRRASSLRFHSNAVCVKGWAEAFFFCKVGWTEASSAAMEFLVVPCDFFTSSGQLKLDVCIKRSKH